jgi:hypothetical protein
MRFIACSLECGYNYRTGFAGTIARTTQTSANLGFALTLHGGLADFLHGFGLPTEDITTSILNNFDGYIHDLDPFSFNVPLL